MAFKCFSYSLTSTALIVFSCATWPPLPQGVLSMLRVIISCTVWTGSVYPALYFLYTIITHEKLSHPLPSQARQKYLPVSLPTHETVTHPLPSQARQKYLPVSIPPLHSFHFLVPMGRAPRWTPSSPAWRDTWRTHPSSSAPPPPPSTPGTSIAHRTVTFPSVSTMEEKKLLITSFLKIIAH
jgi:hypothetical protein